MSYTVKKSFDYANFKIDYDKKDIQVTYPYRTTKWVEWMLFGIIGAIPIFLLWLLIGALLLSFNVPFLPTTIIDFAVFILLYIIWFAWCFKRNTMRKALIKTGYNFNELNQIYLSGFKKRRFKIRNCGNYFTSYELFGDCKELIKTFEIRCTKCLKPKGFGWLMGPKYWWEIRVEFKKIPRTGHIIIYNQHGETDHSNGKLAIQYY